MIVVIRTENCPCRTSNSECGLTNEDCFVDDIPVMCPLVKNGTPIPDNATNGDVIKAIFPDSWRKVYDICAIAWWNALYQKGGK